MDLKKRIMSCFHCILIVSVLLLFPASSVIGATIYYVDETAAGLNNGTSWDDAYVELHDAIVDSIAGDEIWVAAGTYIPTTVREGGNLSDDRLKTFEIKSQVAIYGGFNGVETSRSGRNWIVNITILSGQLTSGPKVYNVVLADNVTSGTILDGFTIQDGEANGSPPESDSGGGIHIRDSTLTIENCIIKNNSADGGGGVQSFSSAITLINCQFNNNTAAGSGGGVACSLGSATIECCDFTLNVTASDGGGMSSGGTPEDFFDLDMHHCLFSSNSTNGQTGDGGGLMLLFTNVAIDQCNFVDNSAVDDSGAIQMDCVNSSIERTRFVGNIAKRGKGGAIFRTSLFNDDTTMCVRNSVFTCNKAESQMANPSAGLGEGGALYFHGSDYFTTLINCTFKENDAENLGGGIFGLANQSKVTIVNTILWGNTDGADRMGMNLDFEQYMIGVTAGNRPRITYSCIQDLDELPLDEELGNNNNIDDDPEFAIPLTCEDDGRLSLDSPCEDEGNNTPTLPVETPCFAAPVIGTHDHDGNPRIYNGTVGMGAFEVTDCNANEIGDFEDVVNGDLGDINSNFVPDTYECLADIAPVGGDGIVNVTDQLLLLASWGVCPCNCPADLNRDGRVNVTDLLFLLSSWGACPPCL